MTVPNRDQLQYARGIAVQALAGERELLLACRDLSRLQSVLAMMPDFSGDVFAGISSEIDGLPLDGDLNGQERVSPENKREIARYRDAVKPAALNALSGLIEVIDEALAH